MTATRMLGTFAGCIIYAVTLPYYQSFHFNTIRPAERIAFYRSQPDQVTNLRRVLSRWRQRKMVELQFVSIYAAVIITAVIGCIQWQTAVGAYWLTLAFWYCTIVCAVAGILLAGHVIHTLNFLGPINQSTDSIESIERYTPLLIAPKIPGEPAGGPVLPRTEIDFTPLSWSPRWNMVFVWQCPVMFTSFASWTFLAGLTVLVVTPLIRLREDGWDGDTTVAIIFLVFLGKAALVFGYCCYWVHQDVDVNADIANDLNQPEDTQSADIVAVAKFLRSYDHDGRLLQVLATTLEKKQNVQYRSRSLH